MDKIASFEIDHNRLQKGVYVSRIDQFGKEILTTFDIRMKKPNVESLENEPIHTIEHLVATYVRNDEQFKDKVAYFGPMGCLTGMYLILHGEYTSKEIVPLLINAFEFIVNFEGDIPGVSAVECGNYKLHSLPKAKEEAKAFLEVLNHITEEQLVYPS